MLQYIEWPLQTKSACCHSASRVPTTHITPICVTPPYLRPLPVPAGHVHRGNVLEELLGRDEVRQAGEELGHVDKVHAGQHVLVEAQQAQRRAEQELLTVPAEDVPHAARQVQRQRLAVEGEDPGGEEWKRGGVEDGINYCYKSQVAIGKKTLNIQSWENKCERLCG